MRLLELLPRTDINIQRTMQRSQALWLMVEARIKGSLVIRLAQSYDYDAFYLAQERNFTFLHDEAPVQDLQHKDGQILIFLNAMLYSRHEHDFNHLLEFLQIATLVELLMLDDGMVIATLQCDTQIAMISMRPKWIC